MTPPLWGIAPDEYVSCPACGAVIPPSLLCEHDSDPLCVDRCCHVEHGEAA